MIVLRICLRNFSIWMKKTCVINLCQKRSFVLFHMCYFIGHTTSVKKLEIGLNWIELIVTRVFEEDKVDYSSIFIQGFDVFWSSKKWLMHKEDFWYFSQSFLGWDITIREVVKRRISSYGMFSRKHLIGEIKMTFCIRSIYLQKIPKLKSLANHEDEIEGIDEIFLSLLFSSSYSREILSFDSFFQIDVFFEFLFRYLKSYPLMR